MGTPDFAVAALRALGDAGHDIAAVYSQPPRAAGRGQQPRPSSVAAFAAERGLTVHTPTSLKDAQEQAAFAALDLDAAVVVAYGLLLPKPILSAARLGCLNIHASLLPRWRGAAPIQRALMAGDAETGITIMQMDEGLDTGPMLLQERVAIAPDETGGSLHDKLAVLGARLVLPAHAAKLTRADERLDWRRPGRELERQVRALAPRPGAWFVAGDERIKTLGAEVANEPAHAEPGFLLDDRLTIACGEGALRLTRLQRAGKAALPAEDFLRGYRLARGTHLPLPERTA
jgi:methionyl-tRNA formyltransferase